jgi:hypothetical protein
MTMDNGEGRPLDEVEAGQEDPQGWYFDLPGGAWERQEEKNRTLRQRVLGNLTEDAEKAKADPFTRKLVVPEAGPTFELRRPQSEPEKKKGRGFFGRGKKQDEEPERQPIADLDDSPSGQFEEDEPDDDWTTEPPLKLSPFPRRTGEPAAAWAETGGGWDL